MSEFNYNTKYEISLSGESVQGFTEVLKKYKEKLPDIAKNIVDRTIKVGLENNLSSAIAQETIVTESEAVGRIVTTDPIDTFREYGTGIVGSENPHPDTNNGWIYDVNNHGEKGWRYPKGDGTFGWTRGLPASKKFYEAIVRMEEEMPNIAREEMEKELGGI